MSIQFYGYLWPSDTRRQIISTNCITPVSRNIPTCIRLWCTCIWRPVAESKYLPCAMCGNLMITSWNGSIFHVTGPLWGIPPVDGGLPSQRPVTRSFDVFFDLRLNKRLRKHRRFETPPCSLWRHCNVWKIDQGYHVATYAWTWYVTYCDFICSMY